MYLSLSWVRVNSGFTAESRGISLMIVCQYQKKDRSLDVI